MSAPIDLPARVDLKLAQDAAHLALDGVQGDMQFGRNLGVGPAIGGKRGYQPFAMSTLAGQTHDVHPEALAPVLVEFFTA